MSGYPRTHPDDNAGRCESCDRPESAYEVQTTYPLKMTDGVGGVVQGTMWLCPACLKQHQERDRK